MVHVVVVIMSMFFASAVHAEERMVGLVEVPALHGRLNSGSPDLPTGPVTLFNAPSMNADVAVVVRDRSHLESKNHSYEQVSAVVYDVSNDSAGRWWYKLRYTDDELVQMFAWLSQADAGQFRMYGDLRNKSGLPGFTENWDKHLYERADLSAPSFKVEQPIDTSIVVAGAFSGKEPKDLWFLVVIVDGSLCGGLGNVGGAVIATGWVPAYAKNGSETIWWGIC